MGVGIDEPRGDQCPSSVDLRLPFGSQLLGYFGDAPRPDPNISPVRRRPGTVDEGSAPDE
jgi:hypothetical protein